MRMPRASQLLVTASSPVLLLSAIAAAMLVPAMGAALAAAMPEPEREARGGSVGSGRPSGTGPEGWQFLASYPRQYVTHKLQPRERIAIDGRLD